MADFVCDPIEDPRQSRASYVCCWCRKSYQPKRSDRTTYCSRECSFSHMSEQRKHREQQRFEDGKRPCRHCSVMFGGHRNSVFCSQECRKASASEVSRNRSAAMKPLLKRTCSECGNPFTPEYGNKRRVYCSSGCMRTGTNRVVRQRRKARERGVSAETVNAIRVFDRDGWKCKLCGIRTPRRLRGSMHVNAPELDHIVPLSVGGSHTYDNVQCACRGCNGRKGARLEGQMILQGFG